MSKPIHSYIDLDVVNNNLTTSSSPVLTFQDTRNGPFLEGDSSEYLCSIIRFSIQTGSSLPIFIPRIQTGPNQLDRNLTSYQINIQYTSPVNGNFYEQYVNLEYIYSDASAPLPSIPVVQQDLSSTYYYVYNASNHCRYAEHSHINSVGKFIANHVSYRFSCIFLCISANV
jgi:hypothetical protein